VRRVVPCDCVPLVVGLLGVLARRLFRALRFFLLVVWGVFKASRTKETLPTSTRALLL
jgi:hypothetical protein